MERADFAMAGLHLTFTGKWVKFILLECYADELSTLGMTRSLK